MNTIKIDLDDILEAKLQFGVSIPVPIDICQFLEYADDDWRHELDLDELLAEERKAAVILSADEIKKQYPHLSDEQAWEATQRLQTDLAMFVEDAIADVVHLNYPSARMQLHTRLLNLRYSLNSRTDELGRRLADEVAGLLRVFHRIPETAAGDPATEGKVAAALDDIEAVANQEGGVA